VLLVADKKNNYARINLHRRQKRPLGDFANHPPVPLL
jgi:hypothetical protein